MIILGFDHEFNFINNNPFAGVITNNEYVHPDLKDYASFGVGAFQYLLSVLPSSIQSLLGWLGFTVNRKRGLEMIKVVAINEGRMFSNAMLLIALQYIFISAGFKSRKDKLEKFKPYMDLCMKKFPNSASIIVLHS
jgi:hypothetical protein